MMDFMRALYHSLFHSVKSHWRTLAEGGQVEPVLGYLLSTKNRHDQ